MLAIMSITALVLYQGYGLQECNVTCDAVSCCVQLLIFSATVGPLSSGWSFLPGLSDPHNESTMVQQNVDTSDTVSHLRRLEFPSVNSTVRTSHIIPHTS